MTQEELWEMAYARASKSDNQFLICGLDKARANGYTIEYDEETKEFTVAPPKGI